ncbi:MAG: phospholipase D-like domain-containing protein [Bacteroidota bacterium]
MMDFEEIRRKFEIHPFVLETRMGYCLENDWIGEKEAIVIKLRPEYELSEYEMNIIKKNNKDIDIDIEFEYATPLEILNLEEESAFTTSILEGFNKNGLNVKGQLRGITYQPPKDVKLEKTNDVESVTCSLSPDNGWDVLKEFIDNVKGEITIGMYDFTAPHILEVLREKANDISKLNLVIQEKAHVGSGTKKDDIPESELIKSLEKIFGKNFNFTYAHVKGYDRIFGGSYHIKVVTNEDYFWLSSGNWQSSNLPDASPTNNAHSKYYLSNYNREWHVVVKSKKLTETYRKFLIHDLDESRKKISADESNYVKYVFPHTTNDIFVPVEFFKTTEEAARSASYYKPKTFKFDNSKPLDIMPLLTPDNFYENTLELLKSAKKSIYFQNQALNIIKKNTSEFLNLLNVLVEKQEQGLDVKIIVRGEFFSRENLERLKKYGFDMNKVKLQDRCHTKGIIIDSEVVLVGSHNFSNKGTTINRDASLIFYSSDISKYYEDVFHHDWKFMAKRKLRTNKYNNTPRLALPNENTPQGMVRIPWDDFYGEL